MPDWLLQLVAPLIAAAAAAGGAWAAVRSEVYALRRDVDRHEGMIARLAEKLGQRVGELHARINRVYERARANGGYKNN